MGKPEMTYELCRKLFTYDPATGRMARNYTTSSRAIKGQLVGCKNAHGYLVVRVGDTLYYVHRLAWLWMTGEWPSHTIDHINRDPSDNRWENLRDVTHSDNHHNRHGVSGVYWAARDKVWVASIAYMGVKTHIGQHKDRAIAEKMYADHKQRFLP